MAVPKTASETLKHKINLGGRPPHEAIGVLLYTPGEEPDPGCVAAGFRSLLTCVFTALFVCCTLKVIPLMQYPFFLIFSSPVVYHRTLITDPCAVQ